MHAANADPGAAWVLAELERLIGHMDRLTLEVISHAELRGELALLQRLFAWDTLRAVPSGDGTPGCRRAEVAGHGVWVMTPVGNGLEKDCVYLMVRYKSWRLVVAPTELTADEAEVYRALRDRAWGLSPDKAMSAVDALGLA